MTGHILIVGIDTPTAIRLISLLETLGYTNILPPQLDTENISAFSNVDCIFAGISQASDVQQVFSTLHKSNLHKPVIFIAKEYNRQLITAAVESCACDIISEDSISEALLLKTMITVEKQSSKIDQSSKAQVSVDYKSVFMQSPHPMWIYDVETMAFLLVNNAAIEKYGYTEDEFLSMTIKDIRPDDEVVRLINERGTRRGDAFSDYGFWLHQRKGGGQFYVNIHSQATNFQGRKASIVVAMDVDEKVKADQVNTQLNKLVAQQKERIDHILSSVKEMIWSCDAQTFRMLYVNEACRDIYGCSPQEMIDDKELYFDLIHPDDKKEFNRITEQIFATGSYVHEYRICHRDGSVKHVRGEAFLKKGSGGEPDIISGLTIDITDLIKIESALHEKVSERDNILNSITDGFFILDDAWRFKYVNKAFERICNVRRADILGQNYWEKFPKSVSLKWFSEYHRAMRDQVAVHFEEFASSLGRWVSVSAYPKADSLTVYFTDVTEEHKLLEKLAYNERNLQALINTTQDVIWSVDKNLCIISANDGYKQSIYALSGRTVGAGDSVLIKEFAPEYVEKWKAYYQKALSGKAYKVVELIHYKNEDRYAEISFNPIRNTEEVIGVSCFSRDITEERKLQDQLAANERSLRALIDNTNDFVWSIDQDMKIVTINKTFKDSLTAVTGKHYGVGSPIIMEDFGPELKGVWSKHYSRALQGEKFMVVEELNFDGMQGVIETSLNPIVDDTGAIVGVSCYGRDITEQRRMQEEIQLNEHNMRGLINSTKDLIWSVDATWHIVSANDAFTTWMKKINGITICEGDYALPSTFGEKIINKFLSYYNRAFKGESFRVTERLKPNKFDIEFIETRYHPIYNDKGVVIGVSCSTRDITETRRYQERIEAKNQKLRDIASIQSHEVRGQVASILGLGQLFNYKNPADPINASVLEGFMEATQNLDRIIRRIVNKTRIMDEM
ncbi:MAG: PAS domain S-box protein [Sphingobacteriales bacterium]|nr:MAG: PAS domain S-box protein [Sphingobacteriales bacterium]